MTKIRNASPCPCYKESGIRTRTQTHKQTVGEEAWGEGGFSSVWPGGREETFHGVFAHVVPKSFQPAAELQVQGNHPAERRLPPRLGQICLAVPIDPHASVFPVHEQRIQRFFLPDPGLAVVVLQVAATSTAGAALGLAMAPPPLLLCSSSSYSYSPA